MEPNLLTDARACNRWFVTLVIMPALLGCSIPSQKQTAPAPAPATEMEPATKPEATSTAPAAVDRLAVLRPRSPRPRSLNHAFGIGIEAGPIPLDSTDPKYADYFEKLRQQIKEKWSYPREASDKNQSGSLLIEFGIRRDGKLQSVELQTSSGVAILDEYAMNAVKQASPFPPVPEALLQGTGIPVLVRFHYVIESLRR
jgi:TonB family protein